MTDLTILGAIQIVKGPSKEDIFEGLQREMYNLFFTDQNGDRITVIIKSRRQATQGTLILGGFGFDIVADKISPPTRDFVAMYNPDNGTGTLLFLIKETQLKRWEIGFWSIGEPELLTWTDNFVEAETRDEAIELAAQQGYRHKTLELREVPQE